MDITWNIKTREIVYINNRVVANVKISLLFFRRYSRGYFVNK